MNDIKEWIFDVFGTLVDRRTATASEARVQRSPLGIEVDRLVPCANGNISLMVAAHSSAVGFGSRRGGRPAHRLHCPRRRVLAKFGGELGKRSCRCFGKQPARPWSPSRGLQGNVTVLS